MMTDEEWAEDLVRQIAEAERLGGGFRLFHETAAKLIVRKLKSAYQNGVNTTREQEKKR